MGIFNKVIASTLGIGGCKIDTVIYNREVRAGEEIRGVLKIYGGKVEQLIEKVVMDVTTQYEKEVDDKDVKYNYRIERATIKINKVVHPNENIETEFAFKIDENCPISTKKYPVWISTQLEIDAAVDHNDKDYITILPSVGVNNVLSILQQEGFKVKKIENRYKRKSYSSKPFIQEFEFVPSTGAHRRSVDELEMIFNHTKSSLEIYMEVDERAKSLGGLFKEALDMDEKNYKVNIVNEDLDNINVIRNLIVGNL